MCFNGLETRCTKHWIVSCQMNGREKVLYAEAPKEMDMLVLYADSVM